MPKKSHYAVTGRVEFDDEDTCLLYHAATKAEAVRAFKRAMREGAEDLKATVYVLYVLRSNAPITIEEEP